ncbi:peptidoglycan DD-metalloendopeptidase family protein [Alienimonas sp. DA493]|uniref:M23 family metallopeptidase n=1 Tax=Alienimonas sp. DA493 TaxID=3373605 RepID=UPI0037546FAE
MFPPRRFAPLLFAGACLGAAAASGGPPEEPPADASPAAPSPADSSPAARPPAEKFVLPIGGEPWKDWAIVNYVDVDPKFRGVRDARGGNYTYDFHEGIDYTLAHFPAMDRGVPVFAAAAGTVVDAVDGHPDRNAGDPDEPGNRPKTPPNLVRIDHPGGVRTAYLHLRKDSILVQPGDRVTAGQKIAEVGSSGRSSDPHLHFEVYKTEGANPQQIAHRGGTLVATLEDPERWWKDPLPYAAEMAGVLDHGVTHQELTEESIRERPTDAVSFASRGPAGGPDRTVRVWARLFGFKKGDRLTFDVLDPRGRSAATQTYTTDDIRYGWWSYELPLPERVDAGRWTVRATRNDQPLFEDEFVVNSRSR